MNGDNVILDDDFIKLVKNDHLISVEIKEVLIDLCLLEKGESNMIADKLMNLIGNNHQGVYYSNVFHVLDYLILLLNHSKDNSVRYVCLLGVLNDLYYFSPDLDEPSTISLREMQCGIKEKLKCYSDEYFDEKLANKR